jgi:4'-phosphopantetheinyl transferase
MGAQRLSEGQAVEGGHRKHRALRHISVETAATLPAPIVVSRGTYVIRGRPAVAHWPGIYIWRIDLARPLPADQAGVLGADEWDKANAIADPENQACWIRSHVALRMILAVHGRRNERDIRFTSGPFGKPRWLATGRGAPTLHFNLSRSGTLCLVAVSSARPVGVDIEQVIVSPQIDELIERQLSPEQAGELQGLAPEGKCRAYFTVLTRREAYAKAMGVGLQLGLRDLQVSADAFNPEIVSLQGDDPEAWRIVPLHPGEPYVASLAVRDGYDQRQHGIHVRSLSFDDPAWNDLSIVHHWMTSHGWQPESGPCFA